MPRCDHVQGLSVNSCWLALLSLLLDSSSYINRALCLLYLAHLWHPAKVRSINVLNNNNIFSFAAGKGAKYCDKRVCMYVCVSVCLSIYLSTCMHQRPHFQTSHNFLYTLPMAVAQSS